jgi:hydrogenase expression/formation protein HypD
MKYVDEFRDRQRCQLLCERILKNATRRWTIMEVCGGQTHGLLKFGIEEALLERVQLLHGPGCPVCVTSKAAIDRAIAMSFIPDVVVVSFGDMLRVPGEKLSLLQAQTAGGQIHTVYSPLDAVKLAASHPNRKFVFFAVGFETTLPATAIAILQAESLGLTNFFVLMSHVRVAPAMEYILEMGTTHIDGFLAAGHVTTVTGISDCQELAENYKVPIVVTGFEPLDLLIGIERCVKLLEAHEHGVVNQYQRVVSDSGNIQAQAVIKDVFEVADQDWRGLGLVPGGGFRLKPLYQRFDSNKLCTDSELAIQNAYRDSARNFPENECRSGEVLTGSIKPKDCPLFGVQCTPQTPFGAPMVSSEGACAAYYHYTLFDSSGGPKNRSRSLS